MIASVKVTKRPSIRVRAHVIVDSLGRLAYFRHELHRVLHRRSRAADMTSDAGHSFSGHVAKRQADLVVGKHRQS